MQPAPDQNPSLAKLSLAARDGHEILKAAVDGIKSGEADLSDFAHAKRLQLDICAAFLIEDVWRRIERMRADHGAFIADLIDTTEVLGGDSPSAIIPNPEVLKLRLSKLNTMYDLLHHLHSGFERIWCYACEQTADALTKTGKLQAGNQKLHVGDSLTTSVQNGLRKFESVADLLKSGVHTSEEFKFEFMKGVSLELLGFPVELMTEDMLRGFLGAIRPIQQINTTLAMLPIRVPGELSFEARSVGGDFSDDAQLRAVSREYLGYLDVTGRGTLRQDTKLSPKIIRRCLDALEQLKTQGGDAPHSYGCPALVASAGERKGHVIAASHVWAFDAVEYYGLAMIEHHRARARDSVSVPIAIQLPSWPLE